MAEMSNEEEMMKQLEKELKSIESDVPDFKIGYLFLYNLFQFVGFTYITVALIVKYTRLGEAALKTGFDTVGTQLMVVQAVAVMEIVHPLLGIVKTSAIAPFLQVLGRNFSLFVILYHEPRLHTAPAVFCLFFVWSAIECFRYPFYMLSTLGKKIGFITWLRYTAWIPLYPLGILLEGTVVITKVNTQLDSQGLKKNFQGESQDSLETLEWSHICILLTMTTTMTKSGRTRDAYAKSFKVPKWIPMVYQKAMTTTKINSKKSLECEYIKDTKDGVYTIYPGGGETAVAVYCIMRQTKKWTVIQRRVNGSVDFYRTWNEYKTGFGSVHGEYWLGNDNINIVSTNGHHELSIYMQSGFVHYTANYSTFLVENENSKYRLTVTGYSGNARAIVMKIDYLIGVPLT
ncbi:very-long-chain (3R)-3-hydroxyacyl-CoA dehydratase [Mytilus galloprovincialis]|uniref:Very-long-chain (3R)-3-hydroxyacyl-CoA dehydratase n=1 Tax=Mytilus galloprovincialis TaxID=29158 RepID=A0A8B6DY75_MYTGA|nr:very-long-chain (3R)-3-hydroxyacyl-CoA dehydratase [Mytilus galloprovincialis]